MKSRPQHPPRVLERRRGEHLDPRKMSVPPFETMRVLSGQLTAGAGRHPDHHRHTELAARHVTNAGRGVENLVEREQTEIHRHQFDDRAHACYGGANAGACETRFRQRCVSDPFWSELRLQPLAHRVATAIAANVFTHEENTLIAEQRVADRRAHSFPVAKFQGFRLARIVRHDAHCPPVRLPFPHR